MLINGNNLMKKIVTLVERENDFLKEMYEIGDKGATAENLQDSDELIKLGNESEKINRKFTAHLFEKTIVMSMAIVNNPNFQYN